RSSGDGRWINGLGTAGCVGVSALGAGGIADLAWFPSLVAPSGFVASQDRRERLRDPPRARPCASDRRGGAHAHRCWTPGLVRRDRSGDRDNWSVTLGTAPNRLYPRPFRPRRRRS